MNKTIASVVMAVLIAASSLAFVFTFFSPPTQNNAPRVEVKPFYESIGEDQRNILIYRYGMTLVDYPTRDEFFNTTLSRIPSLTNNFVAIVIGDEFSIESANGFRKTSKDNFLRDLCELMVRGSLPDCAKFYVNQSR